MCPFRFGMCPFHPEIFLFPLALSPWSIVGPLCRPEMCPYPLALSPWSLVGPLFRPGMSPYHFAVCPFHSETCPFYLALSLWCLVVFAWLPDPNASCRNDGLKEQII